MAWADFDEPPTGIDERRGLPRSGWRAAPRLA